MSDGDLIEALRVAVPLRIIDFRRDGVPEQIEQVDRADDLLYRVKKVTTEQFVKLVDGLAALAFQPGGVRFAGCHFEAAPEVGPWWTRPVANASLLAHSFVKVCSWWQQGIVTSDQYAAFRHVWAKNCPSLGPGDEGYGWGQRLPISEKAQEIVKELDRLVDERSKSEET